MYKTIFNTICDFQEISEMSIFLTKSGTFSKMAPNFVTLGNYNNDHATNLKICMWISDVEKIRRESISIILEITIDQNIENSLTKP